MQVNIDNFTQSLPLISEAIQSASFLALDCEFTGNQVDIHSKPHEFDSFDDKYRKHKTAIEQFLALQIGLTTFHWSASRRKYEGRSFNFLVYPRSGASLFSVSVCLQ